MNNSIEIVEDQDGRWGANSIPVFHARRCASVWRTVPNWLNRESQLCQKILLQQAPISNIIKGDNQFLHGPAAPITVRLTGLLQHK